MNTLDYIILAILIWGFISGFRKGLIMQLALILGVVLGIWLANLGSGAMGEWLQSKASLKGVWLPHLSFLLVFVLVYIVAYISGKALSAAVNLVMLGFVNKLAGGILGIVKMLMVSGVLIVFCRMAGIEPTGDFRKESSLYSSTAAVADLMAPALKEKSIGDYFREEAEGFGLPLQKK